MMRLAPGPLVLAALAACCLVPPSHAQSASSLSLSVAVRNFPPAAYQANRQNWAIAQDNLGTLYFGNTSGVLQFDGSRWSRIAMPGNGGAFALRKAGDGRILVGGQGEVGWLEPDANGSMVYVSKAGDLPDAFRSTGDPVIQILDTPIGQVYVSDHWLFIRSATAPLITLRSGDHFLQAVWFNNQLFVLDSGRGLMRLDKGVLHDVPGGGDMRGVTMVVTGKGLLIPSYNNGLVLYSPSQTPAWSPQHVTGWQPEDNAGVTCASAINDHLIALGTAKHGVALIDIDTGSLLRLGTDRGLADLHVYGLLYDHRGDLWLALNDGLSLVGLGLPPDAEALPFHASVSRVYSTSDDHLLFGGVFFSVAGGVPQLLQGPSQLLRFPYNFNAFRFEFSANGISAKGDMEFQTYMQGVDKDWTPWSSRPEREFTQLSPGKWVLQVRARKPGGAISSVGVYSIRITPAWYNTWWFLVFQVAFVLGALLLPGHAHHYKILQEALTTFAVIVPFIYLGNFISSTVNHYYSTNIGFIQVLVSALLAFVLDPIQNYLKMHVQRRNERRRLHHLHMRQAHELEQSQDEVPK